MLKIITVFEEGVEHPGGSLYGSVVSHSLRRFFSDPFFFDKEDSEQVFQSSLPLLRWSFSSGSLSLFFLSRYQFNIGKVFQDMIHQWLIPGHRIETRLFFSCDFKIHPFGKELYTLVEIVIPLHSDVDLEDIEYNLRVIQTEIRLGMVSIYHTSRLLESSVLRKNEKNILIQEKIVNLIHRKPDEIDYDIFGEMQHFFVMGKEEFKTLRDPHHLSRLIGIFYLFRKSIMRALGTLPDKRHIRLKIATVNLYLPWGIKPVVGICVGLNFLKKNEIFEERHLVKALKNILPDVKPVQDSFFVNEGGDDSIHIIYFEIEKENGGEFSKEELNKMRLFLPGQLHRSIEVALKPLFMPRNEEEVIRYILTLSHELRFVRDLPQVVLSFDEQTETDLIFTVILARVLFPSDCPIQKKFEERDTLLTFIADRIKRLGMVRKKYPKEVTVFRVKFSTQPYLRDDHSVDLFKARQDVIAELQKIVGEIRDYNGGMIAKQIELLSAIKSSLGEIPRAEELLLENFFHSLFPIEMRTILSPKCLKKLFLLWKKILEDKQEKLTLEEEGAFYFVIRGDVMPQLEVVQEEEEKMLFAKLSFLEEKFTGGIYFGKELEVFEKLLNGNSAKMGEVSYPLTLGR